MSRTSFLATSLAVLLSSYASVSQADAPAFDYYAFITDNEQHQVAQMQKLIQASQQFQNAVAQACAQTEAQPVAAWTALAELQGLWKSAAQQWQTVQAFPLGPNTDATVRLNMTFWPDQKNLVERKVKGLLQQGEALDLSQGGITVQGLAASEYLLFDPQHIAKATVAQTCPALQAISSKSLENSQALLSRWQASEFLTDWRGAPLGNERFITVTQASGYLLAGLAQSVETLSKDKLYKPFRLNKEQAQSNMYLTENWRSGLSLSNIQQNIADLEQLYLGVAGQNGPHDLLLRKDFSAEAQAIAESFSKVKAEAQKLQQMQDVAFSEAAGREQANVLYQSMKTLERALKKPLPHFGLAKTFNSDDGD